MVVQQDVEPTTEDADPKLKKLANELDQCADEMSITLWEQNPNIGYKPIDACQWCSNEHKCCAFWEHIEPKHNNKLTQIELDYYTYKFHLIRVSRQVRMKLTV